MGTTRRQFFRDLGRASLAAWLGAELALDARATPVRAVAATGTERGILRLKLLATRGNLLRHLVARLLTMSLSGHCVVMLLLGLGLIAPHSTAEEDPCAAAPPRLAPPPPVGAPPTLPVGAPPTPSFDHPRYRNPWAWIEDGFWGVGFLEPSEEHSYDWRAKTVIPLYAAPGERHVGWLNRGWVQRDETAGMSPYAWVETGYEISSLILAEARDDGWLGLRLTDDAPSDGGILWTHACRLDLGEVRFEIVLWRDLFRSDRPAYIFFRNRSRHALRAEPSAESERLMWIGERDDLEVVEIRGDWMLVRVFQPGKFETLCGGHTEWRGKFWDGWIRWWSEEKGTWLRYPTRGC